MSKESKRIKLPFIFLAFLFYAHLAFGQESPPMMTDDSGVPGAGKWENNIGFAFQGNNNKNSLEGPIIDINYGVGDHIQLKYEMGWISEKGEPLANHLDATVLGFKYNFSDGNDDGLEFSLYPQTIFAFNNESGKKVEFGFILPVAVSKEFPAINFSIQTGFQVLANESGGFYGLMVGREFGERFTIMAELHGVFAKAHNTNDAGAEHEFFFNQETFINVGVGVKISEMVSLLGAFGRKLNSAADAENGSENFAFAGLQLLM